MQVFFIFSSLDSYDSKLHSFQDLPQPTQCCWHNAAPLLPARLAKSNFTAGSSIKSPPHLLSRID